MQTKVLKMKEKKKKIHDLFVQLNIFIYSNHNSIHSFYIYAMWKLF